MTATLPTLNSGDLDTKIELMRSVQTLNRGEPQITSWQAYAQPWAQVLGQNGREAVIGHVLQGTSIYRIRLRYRSDILPSDQIRLAGTIDLNIRSISDPNGRREQILIIADTDGAQKTT